MRKRFQLEPFCAICVVVHVLRGKYGINPLSRPLPRSYHHLYTNVYSTQMIRQIWKAHKMRKGRDGRSDRGIFTFVQSDIHGK